MSIRSSSWNELITCLEKLDPARIEGLRAGATESELDLLRARWPKIIGHPILFDLAAFDGDAWGEEFLLGDLVRLLSVSEILATADNFEAIAVGRGELNHGANFRTLGPVRDHGWNSGWMPFILSNVVPFCIDFDPTAGGQSGQIIRLDVEDDLLAVVDPSYDTFTMSCVRAAVSGLRFPYDF